MIPRLVAFQLSHIQREVLFDHIDAVVPIRTADPRRYLTTMVLVDRGLLRSTYPIGSGSQNRPTHTELTHDGREVVCIILGHYADTLVRTGFLLEKTDIKLPPPVAIPALPPQDDRLESP